MDFILYIEQRVVGRYREKLAVQRDNFTDNSKIIGAAHLHIKYRKKLVILLDNNQIFS